MQANLLNSQNPFVTNNTGQEFSTAVASLQNTNFEEQEFLPRGSLLNVSADVIGKDLIGKSASVKRIFGAQNNTQALLACGGPNLAANSSFDQNYVHAREWIQQHPVGPAVGSPLLASGLIYALVEASFPQCVSITSSFTQIRPVIVGIELEATIQVDSVKATAKRNSYDEAAIYGADDMKKPGGFEVFLKTGIVRVRDQVKIVEGSQLIWIPDYWNM